MAGNAVLVNFSGGETSPKSRGRFDLPWYPTSAKKMQNFIAEISGPARFRPGFRVSRQTRQGGVARAVSFQLSNSQAYELEFTPGFMRVYKNEDLLTLPAQTITGITKASPAVITCSAITGMSNGAEVILDGIVGMPEMNGRQVKLAGNSGNTFQLLDPVTGTAIDSTSFGAYSSGGTAAPVYELAAPYLEADLPSLQWAQNNTTMYLVCPGYAPRKLTVDNDAFTLGIYSRVNDPFSVNVARLGTLIDDFSSGDLSKWTTSGTVEVGASSWRGDTGAGATPYATGYAFRSSADSVVGNQVGYIQMAQLLAYGTWQFTVASPISSNCQANPLDTNYVSWYFMMVDASNSYEFKIYGSNGDHIAIAKYVGGVQSILVTAPITGIRGETTGRRFTISRSSIGEFVVYDNGVEITRVTDNTHITSTIMQLVVYSSGNSAEVSNTNNSDAWDAVNFYGSHLYQTLCLVDSIYISTFDAVESPIAVAFYEGRLGFFGTNQRPACVFLSRAPDDQGNSRYDDFTGGSDADFACFFELAPVSGSVDYISWARGSPDYLFVGTFGGPFRLSGSGLDIPITPSSINARQFDSAGCEETMAAGCAQVFFVQRGGTSVRAIKVLNPYLATFESADLCENAEQIPSESPIQRVVLQQGRPNVLWAYREDGSLVGMTVKINVATSEALTGWHRHKIGGVNAKVIDLGVLQRPGLNDQLWAVTERTVNGITRRYMEIMADDVTFPDLEDFFTGDEDADLAAFKNVVYRKQEEYIHLDAAATYDGSARGVTAAATLTPGATTGTGITFVASQSIFKAADVGSEIWKKPDAKTGLGGGRAVITGYTNATHVTADVTVDFDSVGAIAAGDWYFAVDQIFGLAHLEGARVAVVTDGAVHSDGQTSGYPTITVVNGSIALNGDVVAGVIHVGLPYVGILETHNLEMGGRSGPAQSKPRDISEMNIRFLNSLGVEFGTNLYRMSKIDHRNSDAIMDRPAPVFSGIRKLSYEDTSSGVDDAQREKNVVVCQRLPLPAVIQFVDISYDTTDEGSGGPG